MAQEINPASARPRQVSRWGAILVLVLVAVGVLVVVNVWTASRQPARLSTGLPVLPDLTTQPIQLRERIARAHAMSAERGTAVEGIAELGRLFHANGFSVEAELCWELLSAEQPRNPHWPYFRADLRRLTSDNPAMAALLEETTERAPEYSPAWLRLADVRFKSGETASAERAYRKRLELVPGDPYARLGLARIALQQEREAEALAQIETLVHDAPQFSPGHNLHAELLAAQGIGAAAAKARVLGREAGRFREAEDPWLDELAEWCFDYDRLCIRGTVDNQTKHGDLGRAAFERAIEIRPDALPAYELLGNLYLDSGDAGQARETYEHGLARATGAQPTAHLYVNLSRAYLMLERPADAVRICREGIVRVGEAYELYGALGAALLGAGENEAALEALRTAVARNPAEAGTNYNLAVALIGAQRLDEAVAALHRSLAAQPTFPQSLALLAQVEIDSGRWLGALRYLKPLYESHPELPQAREKMTLYYLHVGQEAEKAKELAAAEEHYRAGLAIDPERAELNARLGTLSLLQRRFADAVGPLEAYRRLQPKDARGALYLAQAYAALGRRNDARTLLIEGAQLAEEAGNATTAEHCREILRRLP